MCSISAQPAAGLDKPDAYARISGETRHFVLLTS